MLIRPLISAALLFALALSVTGLSAPDPASAATVSAHASSSAKKVRSGAKRARRCKVGRGRGAARRRKKGCPRVARSARGRLFSRKSFWNAPLPRRTRLHPDSSRLVAALSTEVRNEVASNTGPWINFNEYSVPVYTVGANAPTVRVILDTYAPDLQRDFEAVPIPAGAAVAGGSDRHLTIYQPSTDTLWEFWLAYKGPDGWHARWGGKMTGVSSNPGYFNNPYGATATSLPLLGGLMTLEELKARRIDHALAIAIPNTAADTFMWPAQRGDGRTRGAAGIPQGTRFRINPRVDLSKLGLSPLGLAMARAAQKYGMVVRDTSGAVVFYGEDPVTATGNPYGQIFGGAYPNHLLRGFPWDKLEVVAVPG